jgi:hypothetical protein
MFEAYFGDVLAEEAAASSSAGGATYSRYVYVPKSIKSPSPSTGAAATYSTSLSAAMSSDLRPPATAVEKLAVAFVHAVEGAFFAAVAVCAFALALLASYVVILMAQGLWGYVRLGWTWMRGECGGDYLCLRDGRDGVFILASVAVIFVAAAYGLATMFLDDRRVMTWPPPSSSSKKRE